VKKTDKQLQKIDVKKLLKDRPSWDEYYLTMAFVVAQRSFDPSTKCGCVIVSKDNRVLSTGYNGPLKGSRDENIPLTRPQKYYIFLHSEENALLAYGGSHYDIQNSTCYVTSAPCHKCLRMMIQKGITKIVYVSGGNAKCLDEEDMKAKENMLRNRKIQIESVDRRVVEKLLNRTSEYIIKRYKE
jgi:dCMP deaminase